MESSKDKLTEEEAIAKKANEEWHKYINMGHNRDYYIHEMLKQFIQLMLEAIVCQERKFEDK